MWEGEGGMDVPLLQRQRLHQLRRQLASASKTTWPQQEMDGDEGDQVTKRPTSMNSQNSDKRVPKRKHDFFLGL